MFIAKNNDLVILAKDTEEELMEDLGLAVYTDIEETDINYQFYNNQYLTPEEVEELKREKINNLTMTKRVFALALQKIGISYTQLKTLIATNEQAQLEWDLCVELQRGNPLLDIMAEKLGVTSEQLDEMFIMANEGVNND